MCHIFHNIISTRKGKKGIIALQGFKAESPNIWFNLYHNESNDPNNLEFDWNGTWYPSLSRFQQSTGLDNGSRFANPQFLSIDPISPNLHINSTSPARDAGNPSHFPANGELDIDGQPRRAGTRTDIGADEIPATLAKLSSTHSSFQLSTFPNPVTDRLFISNLPDNLSALSLIDLQGRPLKTFNAAKAQTEIDVQDLPAGMYFLQISTPVETTLYQIVKK
jgi:hypothetical protein